MRPEHDVIVVGGGFFGLYIASFLRHQGHDVLLCEKESDVMQRASYVNQARVHSGYHYPRSLLTALRSRVNYPRFLAEFPEAIDHSFQQIYAVGRNFSKVSAEQFRRFMVRIGAPIEPACKAIKGLFNPLYVEEVFHTVETAFDAVILKEIMQDRVRRAGVDVQLGSKVIQVREENRQLAVDIEGPEGRHSVRCCHVFNCTYSQINQVMNASNLPLVPLKHEMTEMAVVAVPDSLANVGVTLMCGPFFSCMPFPPLNRHTLSHVRYTPHFHWYDRADTYREAHDIYAQTRFTTSYPHMIRDAQRYLPALQQCNYCDSLWEVKTVLPLSEVDDSRPILFKKHCSLPNYHVVMGGKIDNVYDAVAEIQQMIQGGEI